MVNQQFYLVFRDQVLIYDIITNCGIAVVIFPEPTLSLPDPILAIPESKSQDNHLPKENNHMWIMAILIKIVLCILLVDFISGIFHWLEDAYGNEDWPIIGELVTKPNILHHHDPRYFTRYSWLYSARILLGMGAVILIVAYALGQLNWMVILFVFVGINANEIHKWAHRTPRENGRVITALQRVGLLQSARHHGAHHLDPKNSHYCVITNYLNPLLEQIRLWATMEAIIVRLFGVPRRPDHSVKHLRTEPFYLPNAKA